MYDPDLYLRACRFAAEAHNGQRLPGSELPYLLHVTLVAQEVILSLAVEPGDDADLAVACALLHDTIEDTGTTRESIAERFGEPVAAGVAALSKDASIPRPRRMAESLQRIREQPRAVWRVKLADRITNLQPPPRGWTPERCSTYHDEAREILAALGSGSPYLAGRLESKIAAYLPYCA